MDEDLRIHQYDVDTLSRATARVDPPLVLGDSAEQADALTRKVVTTEIVDNPHSRSATIRLRIAHQRRASPQAAWEDSKHVDLRTLHAGSEVRLVLGSYEVRQIYEHLSRLYPVSEQGVSPTRRVIVLELPSSEADDFEPHDAVSQIDKSSAEGLMRLLLAGQPTTARAIALADLYEQRNQAVSEFQQHLAAEDWSEDSWKAFFRRNEWIFGFGLQYQYLDTVAPEPQVGASNLERAGAPSSDYILATAAQTRFTVLVEVKKPNTELVTDAMYRVRTSRLGAELIGGVTQVQTQCHLWQIEGARQDLNRDRLESEDIFTVQPKGFLIVGNTAQLDNRVKRETFQAFRRNLITPEVVTFDELLERAKWLLDRARQESAARKDDYPPW